MKNRIATISIVGLVTVAATVAICLICIDDFSGLAGLAFGFMLWAEVAFFGILLLAETTSKRADGLVARSAWYVIATVYCVVVFVLSLLCLGGHSTENGWFWAVQIGLFACALAAIIVYLGAAKGVKAANAETEEPVSAFNKRLERLSAMAVLIEDPALGKALSELAERYRFTDATLAADGDSAIDAAIDAIERETKADAADRQAIADAIAAIGSAINMRTVKATETKRGRI